MPRTHAVGFPVCRASLICPETDGFRRFCPVEAAEVADHAKMPPSTVLLQETRGVVSLPTVLPSSLRRHPFIHQGVADTQMPLHPQMTEQRSLLYEFGYTFDFRDLPRLCVAPVIAPEHANLFGS